jgi:hypothetical protein
MLNRFVGQPLIRRSRVGRLLIWASSLIFAFYLINVGSSMLPVLAQTPIDQLQKQQSDLERKRSTVNEQRDRLQHQENSAQTKRANFRQ